MEDSILKSTKKTLGLDDEYTPFDLDIITFINSAFSVLHQIGVGPVNGYSITDVTSKWQDLELTDPQVNLVRTYIFLKVRITFDPPQTSYLLDKMQDQIDEFEWRLRVQQESLEEAAS